MINYSKDSKTNKSTQHDLTNIDQKIAIITALPLFLFGLMITCITIFLIIIGGPSQMRSLKVDYLWHNFAITVSLIALCILIYIAISALRNRLSIWSYTWLGSIFAGMIVSLNLVLDDRAFAFSKFLDFGIVLLILLLCLIILFRIMLNGWFYTALLSMGLCGTLGLSLTFFSVAGSGPFHASAGLLSAVLGLVEALIVYLFLQNKSNKIRIILIVCIGMINIGIVWIVESIFRLSMPSRDVTQFIMLAAFLSGILLIGAVSGHVGSFIQRRFLNGK